MQELQLYIENTRVDLFKDESVSLTQTIQNVKDPAKVFTSFTKTFALPASSTNNKLFKHYYNFNIDGGYDARTKKVGQIELNHIPYKTGRVKLEGVDLKANKPHTYRVTFFGNTVELPDIIGDDKLGQLAFSGSNFNLTYSPSTILNYLKNELYGGKLIVPLITHTQRLFYDSSVTGNEDNVHYQIGQNQGVKYDQLKFAVRLYEIILQIEDRYTIANGYSSNILFSRDFFNTSNPVFYNLYMWLHRKSGGIQPATQILEYTTLVSNWNYGNPPGQNELIVSNTSIFVPSLLVGAGSGMSNTLTVTPISGNSVKYKVIVKQSGAVVLTTAKISGVTTINNLNGTPIVANGVYTVEIVHEAAMTFSGITWYFDGIYRNPPSQVPVVWQETPFVSQFGANATFSFATSEQIPDVSIMSFLTGLFKMFNLVAYLNDSGTIVVRPLEAGSQVDYAYYTDPDINGEDAPVTYNITEYVDTSKRSVDIALPYKEINYLYEDTGTLLAKQHEQLSGTAWGSLSYIGGDTVIGTGGLNYNASTKIYNVSVPFGHMKYERLINGANSQNTTIQWGWSVNENAQSYIGKPLIFYAVRKVGSTNLPNDTLSVQLVGSVTTATTYWLPSNSVSLDFGGGENINFNQEINEYTPSVTFNQTLFADYHSAYMVDVFNTRRRITKLTAFLPLKILFNFKLNDTFKIDTTEYLINSITTNLQNGKSDMELLNKVRPNYSVLLNVTFQGTGGGKLYYKSSVGPASNLRIGDRVWANKELTQVPTAGIYTQAGDATIYTYCGTGSTMSMGIAVASGGFGIVTLTCT